MFVGAVVELWDREFVDNDANQLLPMFYQLIPHNYPTPTKSQYKVNEMPTY